MDLEAIDKYGLVIDGVLTIPRWLGRELFVERYPQFRWVRTGVLNIYLKNQFRGWGIAKGSRYKLGLFERAIASPPTQDQMLKAFREYKKYKGKDR